MCKPKSINILKENHFNETHYISYPWKTIFIISAKEFLDNFE